MSRLHIHREMHAFGRIGWLRAAVLGANDGIVSTGSLIVGVAASEAARGNILIAGAAALVAGAMSMAAGEYVSVSSQADTERADLDREKRELARLPDAEHEELARIYERRGIEPQTAAIVAEQLMAHDALGAHMRDELGITEHTAARPLQASFASAASFATGGALPLVVVLLAPQRLLMVATVATSLLFLATLGAISAKTGGASPLKATVRVVFWSGLAMAITTGVGALVGATG